MPEISIIVPLYNVEQYVNKCVDSILSQTFTDLEVILIDDGSPDSSGQIADDYAKHDSRVKVRHINNGGLSAARNAGIEIATGRYLGFVDGDDYIAPTMYEVLHQAITKADAQLAICGIYDVYPGHDPKQKPVFYRELNRDEATQMIFEGNIISVHAVNKLYARAIFSELRYPVGKYHEDSYVILDVLAGCQRVAVDSQQLYYYLHREGSINTERFSDKQFDFIKAWQQNELRLAGSSPKLQHVAHQRVCFANMLVLDKMIRGQALTSYPKEKNAIVHYLRSNIFFIIKDDIFTWQRKVAMVVLLVSVRLYGRVIGMYQG